ncbi:MCE family protein [PVC group bacterium]|nr:MCE family protein [PVC group bacterium]
MKDRRKERLELKVGIMVSVALLLLGMMIVLFSDDNVFEKGYRVRVSFRNISGLSVGGPVYLSGVEVGRIDQIQLAKDIGHVELVLWVKKRVKLPEDANFTIGSQGIMGERFIEIRVDPLSQAPLIKDGYHVIGQDPTTLTVILNEGEKLLGELKKTVLSINAFMGDPELSQSAGQLMNNFNAALDSIHILADNINMTIEGNREDFSRAIALLNSNLDLLKNMFESIETAEGTLGRLLKDDTIYEDFEALVKDIRAHPWKLLRKTRVRKPKPDKTDDDSRRSGRR